MRKVVVLTAIVIATLGFGASTAHAQLAPPQFERFDNPGTGFELSGWTVDPASSEGVQWRADGTPAFVGASIYPSAFSGPNSLNFNDGINYDDTTDPALTQSATSPYVDVTGIPNIWIGFMVAIDTEPDFDYLQIDIEDSVLGIIDTRTVGSAGSVGTSYTLPDNGWWWIVYGGTTTGLTSVRVIFTFVSDDSFDAFSGVFVDNLDLTCDDVLVPSAPTLVSPIGGATVANPVTLDWLDSTDTASCGAGQVHEYVFEVDSSPLFPAPVAVYRTGDTSATVTGLGPGTWYWRITAWDPLFNSTVSVTESFFIEPEIAPDPPTSLFVNESVNGAQSGRGGFVDPVIDLTPAFSAVFSDPNTVANAVALRFQVSDDPTFATLISDSGPVVISPPLPKDGRCGDLTIANNLLQRDQTYYWRIAFDDGSVTLPLDLLSGLTGPFSSPQSFRTGDDFEFGVRHGSTHHGHRCWVATAAFGSPEASPVQALQSWRFGTMESSAAGRVVSRAYHVIGAEASTLTVRSNSVAGAILPLASILGGSGSLVALCVLAVLAMVGISRVVARM